MVEDYIRRSDALELSREYYTPALREEAVPVRAIKNIPSADVAEVVRCKDCKHRPILLGTAPCPPDDIRSSHHYGDDLTCPYLCDDNYYSRIPADDWFCNHGERMEGE